MGNLGVQKGKQNIGEVTQLCDRIPGGIPRLQAGVASGKIFTPTCSLKDRIHQG